ncbi:single-stranded-DNA-specific exonuclease RecJ [Methanobacterium petrolearium]|uniref:single-stranded-DNA-specific exonuclease RecJ n=1 Tax=Methanobacterium petrolearium TaxID=710190 RepID=UPI001AE97852|nr:single-stranded-DNA-specific exonuclease RecJ [Methanobacterium petrolearium]MBP1946705.1 RecJ-like exonuclease [Methanobacterium petrolearium]BDZ70952.1 single-stranded DNA-binding protein [Methanobacterium petrolearium]
MTVIPNTMNKSLSKAHEIVKNAEDVKIYSHIDCDGISSGAILSSTLDRLEIDHEIEFISLDMIPDLKKENELTIFSDLGSGQNLDHFKTSESRVLILDHHPPLRKVSDEKGFLEVNPHYHGIDGSFEVSGGGMCYLLAKTFQFYDLSWIGVLSAIGDMQNNLSGKLVGVNQEIVKDSVNRGMLESASDLAIYGRQTRPLFVALSYFGDVNLPITNNRNEAIQLLKKLDIPIKNGKKERTLYDLTIDEKRRLFNELVRMMSRAVPPRYVKYVPRLVSGDYYEFLREEKYSPLRDASEFSTAINACSRHKNPEIALKVIKGDRSSSLDEMEELGKQHRSYLAQKMEWIQEEDRIKSLKNLQYFHGNGIKSEVIGTIAGMILSYGDWKKPMLGFTSINEENDNLKVSLRCSRLLAFDGINFGQMISKVASKVGGSGGGHSTACGAYIPLDKEEKFLEIFNESLNGII